MTEWRVRFPGVGAWASGTWDRRFDSEAEARAFAEANGGEAYVKDWGDRAPGDLIRDIYEKPHQEALPL